MAHKTTCFVPSHGGNGRQDKPVLSVDSTQITCWVHQSHKLWYLSCGITEFSCRSFIKESYDNTFITDMALPFDLAQIPGSYTCVIWGLCKSTWQVNLTSYNLSSDLERGKRARRKSTCHVNLSSWLVYQVELVTASGICHLRIFFFQNRYRVGEGVCEIFRSFFCVL